MTIQNVNTTLEFLEASALEPIGATMNPNDDYEIGQVIVADSYRNLRYSVVRMIGAGGMGKVYGATKEDTGEYFAIKTLGLDCALVDAFRWESHVWFVLGKHKNIVHAEVFDRDRQHGYRPFLAIEYVPGGNLRSLLNRHLDRRKVPSLRKTIKTGVEVSSGLLYAQRVMREELDMDFVHRDLKPENILFDADGVAKVTDFGLVKAFGRVGTDFTLRVQDGNSDHITFFADWNRAGTPGYMAPEQWEGFHFDEKTDVYGLGCVLYEMLTGRLPFNFDYAPQHLRDEVPLSRLMKAGVPSSIRGIVSQCLAEQNEERPSLQEIRDQLQEVHWTLFGSRVAEGGPGKELSSEDWNTRGMGFAHLGRYRKAAECLARAVELDPGDALSYINRGSVSVRLEEYDRAIMDFSKAIDLEPNHPIPYNNRGAACNRLKDYRRAITDCSKAIELDPEYVTAYNNRGLAYLNLKDYNQAVSDYSRAIDLDPNDSECYSYNNRGTARDALGDHSGAIADYSKAIELDPNYVAAYFNRATVRDALGDHSRAIADYSKAIELDPSYADAYNNRGNTRKNLEDLSGALADYSKAIELDLDDSAAYRNRGLVHYNLEDYSKAIADYSKALDLDPNDAVAYNNRGAARNALGDHSGAIADYSKAIKLDPVFARAYSNRGRARNDLNRFRRAIRDCSRAIELDPAYAEAYTNRGIAYYHLMKTRKAIADYSKAIELDPDSFAAYFNRGLALGDLRKHSAALEDFTKAMELQPQSASAYYRRAECLEELRRRDDAHADYQKFIGLCSADDPLRKGAMRRIAALKKWQNPDLLRRLWLKFTNAK